jgi:hypothetical protein
MRRRRILLLIFATTLLAAAVTAGLVSSLGGAGKRSFPANEPPTPAALALMRSDAIAAARDAREISPREGAIAATTLQAANSLFNVEGGGANDATPVFIMELHGDFVAKYARAPTAPRGQEMILVFDAKTVEPIAFELNDGSKSVSSLGVPVQAVDFSATLSG